MNCSTEESDFISAHLSPRTGQGHPKNDLLPSGSRAIV